MRQKRWLWVIPCSKGSRPVTIEVWAGKVWDGNTVVTSFMCAPLAVILFRLDRSSVEKPFTSGLRKISALRPSMEIRTTLGSEDFPFGRQLKRKRQ